MANVRAGVAYVDVRLGSVEQLKNKLKSEVEKTAREIGKRVGETISKNVPKNAGTDVGKTTSRNMSSAFFKDAGQSFNAGMRALSQGQVKTFGRFMKEVGVSGGLGIKTGLGAVLGGLKDLTVKAVTGLGSAITGVFSSVPGALKKIETGLNAVSQKIGFTSFQFMNLGFIASTAFTAPVAALLTFGAVIGIKTASQIEQATAALKALTPAGTDVEALIKRLQLLAQRSPIFNTVDVVTFTQKMVASGLTVKQTEAFLQSFGRIALTVGADVSKIPFALEALVQMVGKGTVSMEELRQQLGDALPGAMTIVAKSLGVTQAELFKLVKAGKISGKDLVLALTKIGNSKVYLDGASKGAETLGAKFQQLKETVTNQLGQIFLDNSAKIKKGLDDLGPIMNELIKNSGPVFVDLIKGFTGLVKKIGELVNWYKQLDPEQQSLVKKLALIAVVAGPVIIVLGALMGAVAGIAAGLALVATPVGAVILGVAALAAGFIYLWKSSENLRTTVTNLWNTFKSKVVDGFNGPLKQTIQDIKDAWEKFMNTIATKGEDGKRSFAGFINFVKILVALLVGPFVVAIGLIIGIVKGLVGAIGPVFAAIISIITGAIKLIRGIIILFIGLVQGDWSKMGEGLKEIWNGLWDIIMGTLVNVTTAIINFIGGFVSGIVDFFKWLYNVLVGHSIIPDMVNAILDWFRRLVNSGKSVIAALGAFFSAFYGTYIAPFVNAVKNGFNSVMTFIQGIPGKIKGAFVGAGSWLFSAGKDIINGLMNGMESLAGNLATKAANLAKNALEAAKHAIGVKSPSVEFMKVGRFVVLGFIKGIQQMIPKMETEMKNFASMMPETATPNFGDAKTPVIDQGGLGKSAALNIENYYANADADPRRQAEDWYFIVSARGGNA
jgi:tape measure domain-containing protein